MIALVAVHVGELVECEFACYRARGRLSRDDQQVAVGVVADAGPFVGIRTDLDGHRAVEVVFGLEEVARPEKRVGWAGAAHSYPHVTHIRV